MLTDNRFWPFGEELGCEEDMKTEELKTYWQELVTKRNIPQEVASKVMEALGHEAVQRAFVDDWKPISEYSRDLDKARSEAQEAVSKWQNWYEKEALPVVNRSNATLDTLNKYKQLYGDLDSGETPKPSGLSEEKLKESLELQNRVFSDLLKTVPSLQLDYYKQFGEVLDVDEVEKLVPRFGGNVKVAYQEYIKPRVEAKHQADFEAAKKAEYERGLQEGASRAHSPVDNKPKGFSPLTGYSQKDREDPNAGRNAFLEEWSKTDGRVNI